MENIHISCRINSFIIFKMFIIKRLIKEILVCAAPFVCTIDIYLMVTNRDTPWRVTTVATRRERRVMPWHDRL